jgi:hypothetical protein
MIRINIVLDKEVKQRSFAGTTVKENIHGRVYYSNKVSKEFKNEAEAIESFNKMVKNSEKNGIKVLKAEMVEFKRNHHDMLEKISTKNII